MSILDAIILGIVQGLTEWLPVSSSGHLVIFQELFSIKAGISFDLAVHLGTLLVVFVYFWRDIVRIAKAIGTWDYESEYFRLGIYVLLASVVTGVFGVLFYEQVSKIFSNALIVGILLVINGLFLILVSNKMGWTNIDWVKSLIIGFGQAVSILPGISRSGATIGSAMLADVRREEAFRFSFLLSIPAIIGANLYSLSVEEFVFDVNVVVGIIFAFVFGYLALIWLRRWLISGKLKYFGYYCLFIGVITIVMKTLLF